MNDAPRLHVDPRGRVIVENATAEIMEALAALQWPAGAGFDAVRVAVEGKPQRAQGSRRTADASGRARPSASSAPSAAPPPLSGRVAHTHQEASHRA